MNQQKVSISRHKYVLDWFDIETVEIDIKKDQFFEFQYRFGGDWYLIKHDHNGKKYVRHDWGRDDFRLNNPQEALSSLGEKVAMFTSLTTCMGFNKALRKLIGAAS